VFFFLSKTLDVLLDPLWWWLIALVVGGALVLRGRVRAGVGVAATGAGLLLVFALPPVAQGLWSGLEADAERTFDPTRTYATVVLLGGTINPVGSTPTEIAWNDNADRLLVVFDLLRTEKVARAIVSGGPLREGLGTEGELLRAQLLAWGIDPSRVVAETQARNTAENARYARQLLQPGDAGSLLVVTSAFHVVRAQRSFRAVGLEPHFLPVDYRARVRGGSWVPRTGALQMSAEAVRELAGRWIYRLTGV
jgi:uncharacterized SAM-binding protein YcdF (DUF218 family)